MQEKLLCNTCELKKDCRYRKIYIRTQNFLHIKQKEKQVNEILHIKCDNYK